MSKQIKFSREKKMRVKKRVRKIPWDAYCAKNEVGSLSFQL